MFGFRQALLFTTLLTSAFVSAAPQNHDDSIVDWGRLSAIIDDLDANVLHNVLHNLSPKFRDGVFSKDRAAIEHVHSENPVMASKLVYIAKRQNNGTAVAAVTDTPSATSVEEVAPTVSDAVSSLITASTVPAPTTIELAPSTNPGEIAVSTVPGGVVFSTEGGGVVTRTSSAVNVRFTRSTSTHTYYSTAADGSVTTSTSLVVVNAPVTETAVATGAAGAAQASSDPGLQNAAGRSSPESLFLGMIGAGLVGVVGLFVAL
ncbi:hypothetical protein LTR70_002337 [Exophiala xenobiotica]|uniref:Uncharacterized protein n=1 Tax=Lithohypha guttulata TaxID=1690604 RepID=A0ABR0KLA6_9EURO|nr:hypothetical protein LTR24_001241 [Lithohypha guttulata]KAK5326072.1 hypothetical protein LTR70_002337 [Exophiala xenobiotica]